MVTDCVPFSIFVHYSRFLTLGLSSSPYSKIEKEEKKRSFIHLPSSTTALTLAGSIASDLPHETQASTESSLCIPVQLSSNLPPVIAREPDFPVSLSCCSFPSSFRQASHSRHKRRRQHVDNRLPSPVETAVVVRDLGSHGSHRCQACIRTRRQHQYQHQHQY